jgi:predicted transcriptional regulator of viral defense system
MEFPELVDLVGNEPVFESSLLLAGQNDTNLIRLQLSRWKKSGKVYQLRRGLYTLAPPYQKVKPHPFLLANRLVSASYVSLQSLLAYYGMIPEYAPVTTSVTTKRSGRWDTPLGVFDFFHLQTSLLTGYQFVEVGDGQQAFIASPEKALLDLVYLTPGGDRRAYFQELRLDNLDRLDLVALEDLTRRLKKPRLLRAAAEIHRLVDESGGFTDL